jgi:3-hydroxyacyl-[acyl-carrier-protein] dehydratase
VCLKASIARALISGPHVEAEGTAVLEFQFRPDDPTFRGHFPNRPVVPGVYQLEMARRAAESVLTCRVRILEIIRAKFLRPIGPTEEVRLDLKIADEGATFRAHAAFSVNGRAAGEILLILCRSG